MAYTNVDNVSYELNGLTINSSTTPSEDAVNSWITQAQSEIESKTGKVWEAQAASSVVFDADGSEYFRFPESPVISVSSLEYEENGLGADSESWVSLTQGRTNDYLLYVNDGEVEFTGKTSRPPAGKQNLRASYVYGFSTTPPKVTRLATLIVAKRVVDAVINASASEEGGSVTVGNISITDPTTFSVSRSGALKQEIQDVYDEIVGSSFVYRPSRRYELRN